MTQIPIFFTFDRNYVVPAAVAFHSLLRRADPQYTYRLYVLYTDIPETDRQRLTRLVERTGHGTLEFIDVSAFDKSTTSCWRLTSSRSTTAFSVRMWM